MGYMKRILAEREARASSALDLLLEVDALCECEFHGGTYWQGPAGFQDACRLFNHRVTTGQIVLESGETRHDWTDVIKQVYEDNGGLDGCPQCERNFGDD